jgi:hypothetical protein
MRRCDCVCGCRKQFDPEKWYQKICRECIDALVKVGYKGHK